MNKMKALNDYNSSQMKGERNKELNFCNNGNEEQQQQQQQANDNNNIIKSNEAIKRSSSNILEQVLKSETCSHLKASKLGIKSKSPQNDKIISLPLLASKIEKVDLDFPYVMKPFTPLNINNKIRGEDLFFKKEEIRELTFHKVQKGEKDHVGQATKNLFDDAGKGFGINKHENNNNNLLPDNLNIFINKKFRNSEQDQNKGSNTYFIKPQPISINTMKDNASNAENNKNFDKIAEQKIESIDPSLDKMDIVN